MLSTQIPAFLAVVILKEISFNFGNPANLFPTTKMTRCHHMLGYAGWRLGYQNIVELWVRVKNGVGIRVTVTVWVWVKSRVRVRRFSDAKLRIFSQEK